MTSFFKKLFSSNKELPDGTRQASSPKVQAIHTKDYFDKRYTPDSIDPGMLAGCLKMIESYCSDNKITLQVESPINHPENLDQVDQAGFGFVLYCQAFDLSEEQATLFLAYSFSDFLISKYGFQLFKDATPDYPLRSMTLKYDKNGVVLSLYPYEYATKVLHSEATFVGMEENLNRHLAEMPDSETAIHEVMKREN